MEAVAFLRSFIFLFWNVVLPILCIAALGYALQRRFPLDLSTLSKIQIYLFVPTFLFVRVSGSNLSWSSMGLIAGAVLTAQAALALPIWSLARRRGISAATASVVVISSAGFNAGNFGIPLAERAYPGQGGAVQALVLMACNVTIWVLGYILISAASGAHRNPLLVFLRTPMFFALVMALLAKATNIALPAPVRYPLETIAGGLVPLALVTLGAQLARQVKPPNWRRVLPVMSLKLAALPLVMAGVVWLFGLWPWPGAMLIVASAAPSAVNTFLLALELKGDSELAAECIFWTTLTSALTVTITLAIVKALGGYPPG
jgi:hypothetical protein